MGRRSDFGGTHKKSGAWSMTSRMHRLRLLPSEAHCAGCEYRVERGGLYAMSPKLCYAYCWKRAIDKRTREYKQMEGQNAKSLCGGAV